MLRSLRLIRHYSDNSALADRFERILEQKLAELPKSVIDRDPTLQHLYKKHQQQQYDNTYQKELGYLKSEGVLRGKDARDLADTVNRPAWDGNESPIDALRRMIADSLPKSKPVRQAKLLTPVVPTGERLRNAKENLLDYKVNEGTKSEAESFRELYKERLLGPSMFVDATSPRATLGMATSMADAKINAAIDRKTGSFNSPDMDSVRGKPLDRQRLVNSTDTNFFVNEILNKQECLPPWIENQQGVEREIAAMRRDLERKWFDELTTAMEASGGEELSAGVVECAGKSLHDRYEKYFAAKFGDINNQIRTYNLQCPSSALHKWKLVEERELLELRERCVARFFDLRAELAARRTSGPKKPDNSGGSMFGLFDSAPGGGGGSGLYEFVSRPGQSVGIWKLIREMWKSPR